MFKFAKQKETTLEDNFEKLLVETEKKRVATQKLVNSVAILTTDDISSDYDLQHHVEKILNVRNTKIYSFRDFDENNAPSYKHFSEDFIARSGKILEISFKSFLENKFDLLLCFYKKRNLYLEYATLYSKAGFKVGFNNVNSKLFDMEIQGEIHRIEEFTVELKKYLQILNKLPKDF